MRISDWSSDVCSSDLLENQLKRDTYAVDTSTVRKYFEFERTLAGLLDITAAIYDLKYTPVSNDPRVWHADVKVFEDRKSVVSGKSVSVRVDLGGRRIIKQKKHKQKKDKKHR